jgi:hypothetical protein
LPFRIRAAFWCSTAAVVSALLLWPILGNVAAYIALFLLLPAAMLGINRADMVTTRQARWVWISFAAFGLVTAAFMFQPGHESLIYSGDFAIFAVAPVIALALGPWAREKLTLDHLSVLCVVSAAVAAAIGIFDLIQGQPRASALNDTLSPIHYAVLALMFGFMGLASLLHSGSLWRWALLLGPILGLVACIATGTRAAVIVGCVLAAIFGAFWVRQLKAPLWLKLLLPLIIMLGIAVCFYIAHLAGYSRVFNGFWSVWAILVGDPSIDTSTTFRLEMYRSGLIAFSESPIYGHGWREQISAALPHLNESAQAGFEREQWSYIHNDALSLAVSAGGLGLIAYVLMILLPIVAAFEHRAGGIDRRRLYMASICTAALVGGGLTDVLMMVELPKLLLVMIPALLFFTPTNGAAKP